MAKKPAPVEVLDELVLTDLEQVKVLADPLRIRILESLATERTTKQVAELIGEKPTRLYHHVEALERVGVIRLTRTQQNRGTVEKYYRAVARSFKADSALFAPEDGRVSDTEVLQSVASTVLENTANDLRRLIADGQGLRIKDEGILSYCEVYGDQETIDKIRVRLQGILEDYRDQCAGEELPTDGRRYRMTIAYFPLDRPEPDDSEPAG